MRDLIICRGKPMYRVMFVMLAAVLVSACAPEVGSKEWCKDMKEKPKSDWTSSEAGDYAKHCLFK